MDQKALVPARSEANSIVFPSGESRALLSDPVSEVTWVRAPAERDHTQMSGAPPTVTKAMRPARSTAAATSAPGPTVTLSGEPEAFAPAIRRRQTLTSPSRSPEQRSEPPSDVQEGRRTQRVPPSTLCGAPPPAGMTRRSNFAAVPEP